MADDDLDILAWTMLGEAGGEGTQGMTDVGHVVVNRFNTGRYGGSIQDVALSPNQFSTWNSGSGGNDPKGRFPKGSAEFNRARQLAEQVVAGTIAGPPGRPLDYHAPSVSPYWADSKDRNGTYTRNGHVFYPSAPVPPGEIPNVVGSLTDTVPGRAVTPVTPTPDMAMMRRAAVPSQLIPDTFGRILPRVPRQPMAADMRATRPNAVTPYLNRDGQGVTDPAAIVFSDMATNIGLPGAPRPPARPQSYASQERAPPRVPPIPASVEDRVTARNTALRPTVRLPEIPPSRLGQAPVPASVEDRVTARNRVPMSMPQTYAGQERGGPIGQPPTTRTVQSVPMPPRPSIPQSYAGMERAGPQIPTRLTAGQATVPDFNPAPAYPAPIQSGGLSRDALSRQLAVNTPRIAAPTPPQTMMAGTPYPMPRPSWMPQVGTQLATTPVPPRPIPSGRIAPVPFDRPNFGMGGPDIVPTRRQAPIPMQRPQRPARQTVITPRQFYQETGVPSAQAYELVNEAARMRARQNASNPSHQSSNSDFNQWTSGY